MPSSLISIIIPIYNAGKNLKKCIDSVLNQTYPNFELILVNDGSIDQSKEMCDTYADQDNRVKVIHQKNGGASKARNTGIDEAMGKYITFIDADDYVNKTYLEDFFKLENSPENVLVVQGHIKERENGQRDVYEDLSKKYSANMLSDMFLETDFIRRKPFPWAKIFQTSLIKTHKIYFPENISFGEDLVFVLDYILQIDSVITIGTSNYHYGYNLDSLSQSLYNPYSEVNRFDEVKNKLALINKKHNLKDEVKNYHNKYTLIYLERAFQSLYFGSDNFSFSQRIKFYKDLSSEVFRSIKRYSCPTSTLTKITKYLFCKKYFKILDLLVQFRLKLVPKLKPNS